MEERGLKVLENDKRFFKKIGSTISKLLIPTRLGINGMMISMKRNSLLKAYQNYIEEDISDRKEALLNRYEEAFSLYLESIDKYIMDSIYKKVKNSTASNFEENALSMYYEITHLKETEYMEYKYRKQKYLLEIDYETVKLSGKEKLHAKYIAFYVDKMDSLYKGILKNYSIKLADSGKVGERTKKETFNKIFETLEEYIDNILPIKIGLDSENTLKEILEDYDKFKNYEVGKLDKKDNIEKKVILLGISRKLFTHSLPLVVAEQCYIELIKETRNLVVISPNENKKEKAYQMLLQIIEDYNVKLLSTKVYWDKPNKREEYKDFWDKYKKIEKIKSKKESQKLKEILFIQNDLKALNSNKLKYKDIIKFYKRKLVSFGVMKELKNSAKTLNVKYTKKSTVKSAV